MTYPDDPVFKFLMGEGTLDGVHFGEKPEGERGQFWWRTHLRSALSTVNQGRDALVEALELALPILHEHNRRTALLCAMGEQVPEATQNAKIALEHACAALKAAGGAE